MFVITPDQAAEIAYALTEFAVGAAITKEPATLPGFQALGPALIGVANGTQLPTGLEAPVELLLKELGVDTQQGALAFLVDGAITQLNAAASKSAPAITTGILNSVLTDVGNAVIKATQLYVSNHPAPAAPAAA